MRDDLLRRLALMRTQWPQSEDDLISIQEALDKLSILEAGNSFRLEESIGRDLLAVGIVDSRLSYQEPHFDNEQLAARIDEVILKLEQGGANNLSSPISARSSPGGMLESSRIIVLHDKDAEGVDLLLNFLGKLKLDVFALRDIAPRGQGVVDLSERVKSVSYVVAIAASTKNENDATPADISSDVTFLIGRFSAKVAADNVSILCAPNINIPPSLKSFNQIVFDASDAWKFALISSFNYVGIRISTESI